MTHSFLVGLTQRLRSTGNHQLPEEMGRDLSRPNVCFGSKADIVARRAKIHNGDMGRTLMALLVLLALGSAAIAKGPPVKELYGGGYGKPGAFTYTQIELERKGTTYSGKIHQPYDRTDTPPAKHLSVVGNRLRFTAGGTRYDLKRTAIGLEGSARLAGGRILAAFFVLRPGSPPAELLKRLEGSFDLGNGRILTLSRNNDSGGFWYVDLPSGRTGFLYNISDYEFIAGPCLYCAGPERLRVRFDQRGGPGKTRQVSVRAGAKDRIAPRLRGYREEEVRFPSADGTRLAGSLFIPAGGSKYPAVVLVHGSGGQTRNGYYGHIRFLAEAYARRGIAAFAYDKRGTGESGGDYDKAGFAVLADDASAALRYLSARRDINADRLGLSGASQAGWLVPMAATRFPTVKTLQIRSGSAPMGVEESERRRLERQMRADGFGSRQIEEAMRVRMLMDEYARTGTGWPALTASANPVKNEYWMNKYIGSLPARDSSDWPWLREAFSYDVQSDFARYSGRWQILFGGTDALIDPALVVPLVRQALASGAAEEVSIKVLPKATHNGFEGKSGGEKEFPGLSRFVPHYFDEIVDWAAQRLR